MKIKRIENGEEKYKIFWVGKASGWVILGEQKWQRSEYGVGFLFPVPTPLPLQGSFFLLPRFSTHNLYIYIYIRVIKSLF